MAVQIQLRRGTAAQWTSADPTLAAGELGVETDTGKVKVGDGSTAWTSLGYVGAGAIALDDLSDVTITAAASGDILRHNGTDWVDTPGTTHFEAAGAVSTHNAATGTAVHGLGTMSTQAADNVAITGGTVTGVTGPVMASLVDAKGDLLVATADNTVTRLAVGATDGHVLTVDAAEATGVKWAAAAGGGDAIPVGHAVRVDVFELFAATVGASVDQLIASTAYGNATAFKEGQNDEYAWDVYLTAGTYQIDFFYQKGTSHGIVDIELDGSSIGTVDSYNGSTTNNNKGQFTGVVVATSGVKRFNVTAPTKNASSSNYRAVLQGTVRFTRTA